MPEPFRIQLFLDLVLAEPWREGKSWHARPLVRAIPEIAVVRRGTEVHWQINNVLPKQYQFPVLRWEIYFDNRSPFTRKGDPFAIETGLIWNSEKESRHSGTVNAGTADEDGEFKYGIRVIDVRGSNLLSDEDPMLVIR